MTALSISNVVNVSVAAENPGVNAYNTSNLAIITGEPVASAIQKITFSAAAASGAFVLRFGTTNTSSIAFNATADTIQGYINAITGYENVLVSGSIASKTLTLTQPGQLGAITLATVPTNTLKDAGSADIVVTTSTQSSGWSGGSLGYSMYITPDQVGIDFGTDSMTFKQANAIFSQQPNILAGNGQLIVILRDLYQQEIVLSAAPTGGAFSLGYGSDATFVMNYDWTTAHIQTAIRGLPGLEGVIVTGSVATEKLTVYFSGLYGAPELFTVDSNTLVVGTVPVDITITETETGKTYGEMISDTQGLVQYFGVMPNENIAQLGQADVLEAAGITLPLNLIGFFVSYNQSDIQPGGTIDLLATGNFNNSRGLYYGNDGSYPTASIPAVMMASYAGRALSVNFNGSNTTITMNLKQLLGIEPDPSMTQSIWNLAKDSGADIYVSYQGDSSVVSNGANKYFDQVYNLEWFVGALQVAGYNYLAQTGTKVPQTEQGMDGLKGAYRTICQQAVTNQYSAPGSWTSSTTFGNQILFFQNISQFGYYIYSQPISQQLAAARAAREAPLVQIALKEAGSIQESSVLIFVNP